jgi:hypothetical protein
MWSRSYLETTSHPIVVIARLARSTIAASQDELADLVLRCSFMLAPTRSETVPGIGMLSGMNLRSLSGRGPKTYQWTFLLMGWEA